MLSAQWPGSRLLEICFHSLCIEGDLGDNVIGNLRAPAGGYLPTAKRVQSSMSFCLFTGLVR